MGKEKVKEKVKVTIHINGKPYHFDKKLLEPQDFQERVGAPHDYEVWKVVKKPDPEGQLPIDDIQITESTEVKSGERFRVVPPGTFGA